MSKRMGYAPKQITFDGMTKTALEWAEYLGITRSRLYNRLREWPIEQALSRDRQQGMHKMPGPRVPVSYL